MLRSLTDGPDYRALPRWKVTMYHRGYLSDIMLRWLVLHRGQIVPCTTAGRNLNSVKTTSDHCFQACHSDELIPNGCRTILFVSTAVNAKSVLHDGMDRT
jgi:hypothetical protein